MSNFSESAAAAPMDAVRADVTAALAFFMELDRLKRVERRNHLADGSRRENTAEHSWHLGMAVLVLAPYATEEIDVGRAVAMALAHDIVEIDAGDTFAYDNHRMADQHARESRAAERIFGLLPEDQSRQFRELWDEFEAKKTPEARFAAAVDRFQPVLLNLLTQGSAWRRHGVTHDRVVARNRHIAEGSSTLWEWAEAMLEEAVRDGRLPAGPATDEREGRS